MVDILSLDPMPPYVLVKIGKEEQRLREEYLTKHILANPVTTFMTRKCQFGEVVAFGSAALEYIPCIEIGDYLLFHHMIEGKKTDSRYSFYLVDEDGDFNYYMVNIFEVPGERAMAFAIRFLLYF